MAKKKKVKRLEISTQDGIIISVSQKIRDSKIQYYREKFFNKFLNKFSFEGLDYQQIYWMMKQYWSARRGTVAYSILKMSKSEKYPQGTLLISPYAMGGVFNMYDFCTQCTLIDTHATGLLPTGPQNIDEDVVLGWITRTHKGVYTLIQEKLEELVDTDIAIRCNLKAMKMPWMVGTTAENKKKMEHLWESLDEDDPVLWLDLDDINNLKVLNSGVPFIIDKLEVKRQQLEDEINTQLGFNSVGIMEKKEHLTTGEVAMNGEASQASNDIFYDCLVETFQRVKDVLGYEVKVILNKPEIGYNEIREEDKETPEEEEVQDD